MPDLPESLRSLVDPAEPITLTEVECRSRRRHRTRKLALAAVAVAAAAIAVGVAIPQFSSPRHAESTLHITSPSTGSPSTAPSLLVPHAVSTEEVLQGGLKPDSAMAQVKSDTVKQMTWSQFWAVMSAQPNIPSQLPFGADPNATIDVLVQVGTANSGFFNEGVPTHGSYSWTLSVIDPTTGSEQFGYSNPTTPFPAFFNSLPGRAMSAKA